MVEPRFSSRIEFNLFNVYWIPFCLQKIFNFFGFEKIILQEDMIIIRDMHLYAKWESLLPSNLERRTVGYAATAEVSTRSFKDDTRIFVLEGGRVFCRDQIKQAQKAHSVLSEGEVANVVKVSFQFNGVLCTDWASLETPWKAVIYMALLYRIAGLLVGTAVCWSSWHSLSSTHPLFSLNNSEIQMWVLLTLMKRVEFLSL